MGKLEKDKGSVPARSKETGSGVPNSAADIRSVSEMPSASVTRTKWFSVHERPFVIANRIDSVGLAILVFSARV